MSAIILDIPAIIQEILGILRDLLSGHLSKKFKTNNISKKL